MTDTRQLLEDAAKAAGYERMWIGEHFYIRKPAKLWRKWNPRDDDSDALRLAVTLGFTAAIRSHECEVFSDDGECLSSVPIFTASAFVKSENATDPYAATRLAITRAAAAIGKQMKEQSA